MSSAAVSPVSSAPSGAPSLGVALLLGRIVDSRRIKLADGPMVLTRLRLPAADQFSQPAMVEVRSREPIGQPDQDVRLQVRVGGYPNTYDDLDKSTGEVRGQVRTARNTLDVVVAV